ncbi:MAG: hypothetical protein HOM58_17790 [Rhodospirillaceae bacterium]|jgi:hypothetical protein|nr:hypothetical protein [Rhodospirillaceae bacterium]MBT5457203.1 hypothetical protein [Rhodospirillaceae bacterium]
MTRDVLLIGSVPLDAADSVFTAAGRELGDLLHRIPDGECGERLDWVAWQSAAFERIPFVEHSEDDQGGSGPKGPQYRVRPGFPTAAVQFGPLGYREAAQKSYDDFKTAKAAGALAPDSRFQVGLATALSVVGQYMDDAFQAAIEPAYEHRLLEELDEIAALVPPEDLAIQWNLATELSIIEGRRPVYFDKIGDGILERIVRACERVPEGAELGLHFCFRDFEFQGFPLPKDLDGVVDLANGISGMVARSIQWMHFPVPTTERSGAYFDPLDHLTLRDETALFLGVIHDDDGMAVTQHQIAMARQRVANFGVACECGLSEIAADDVSAILDKHRLAAQIG